MKSVVHYITGTNSDYLEDGNLKTAELLNFTDWSSDKFRLFTPYEDIMDASISIVALPLGLPIIFACLSALLTLATLTALITAAGYLIASTSILWKEENKLEYLGSTTTYALAGLFLGIISLALLLLTAILIPLTLLSASTRTMTTLVSSLNEAIYENPQI